MISKTCIFNPDGVFGIYRLNAKAKFRPASARRGNISLDIPPHRTAGGKEHHFGCPSE